MKFLISLLTLFLAYNVSATSIHVGDDINVEICNPDVTNTYINNPVLEITPFPVKIEAGATIQWNFAMDIIKEMPVGTTLTVTEKKGILPIPCLEVI